MLEWILSSCVLILAVLGLRLVFRDRIGHRLRYGLWALVLLRLLIPGSILHSAMSVSNLVSQLAAPPVFTAPVLEQEEALDRVLEEQQVSKEAYDQLPDFAQSRYEQQAQVLVETSRQEAQAQIQAKETRYLITKQLLLALWLVGCGIAALGLLAANLRFGLRLKRSRKQLERPGCPLPVYVSGTVEAPCLFGIFRPAIYLPEDLSPETLPYILAHEQTHFRHRDHIWAALRSVCLALHWYNPLVWLSVKLSRSDSELACDEGTLERLGEASRETYGKVLIEMSRGKSSVRDLLLTATTMSGDKQTLYARIKAIARKPKVLASAIVLAVLIAAIAVGCTFTGAETPEEPTEPQETTLPAETTAPTESTVPTATEFQDTLGYPLLTELPWTPTKPPAGELGFDDYFREIRFYQSNISRIHPSIKLDGVYYVPVAVEDRFCLQVVRSDGSKSFFAIGTETYPGLHVIGTDQYWFYGITKYAELFRVDPLGNKQILYIDETGRTPIYGAKKDNPHLFLTDDGQMLIFTAGSGTAYGIYRLHLPSLKCSQIAAFSYLPTVVKPSDNYHILWWDGNRLHSVENKPEVAPPDPDTLPASVSDLVFTAAQGWKLYDYEDYFAFERWFNGANFGEMLNKLHATFTRNGTTEYYQYVALALDGDVYIRDWDNTHQLLLSKEGAGSLTVMGTDGWVWTYCIRDGRELFRVDTEGNRQTLYTGDLSATEAGDMWLLDMGNLAYFLAVHPEGWGIYRLHIPSGTVDLMAVAPEKPDYLIPDTNYRVRWYIGEEKYETPGKQWDLSDPNVQLFQQLLSPSEDGNLQGRNNWYNMAAAVTFTHPEALGISGFLRSGFRDLPTSLTQEEKEYFGTKLPDHVEHFNKLPVDRIDQVLQAVFGIGFHDLESNTMADNEEFLYREDTNTYYGFFQNNTDGDGFYVYRLSIEVHKVEVQPDGTLRVYYLAGTPSPFASALDWYEKCMILRPVGDSYQVLSNTYAVMPMNE